ncbi:MAG: solute:sodium symporter family transporter [Halieaceae bacterium]
MTPNELAQTVLSCFGFMALVASIAWFKTRGTVDTGTGYFLAGRGLGATFIAGSLLLTNLSAEQLIGLNGSAYGYNLSSMGWEVTAAVATVVMAFFFLPRYLSGAFTTLPEFLSTRFDASVRRMTVVLFLLGYGLVTIPSVLYAGSIAVLKVFDVPVLLGLDFGTSLALVIVVIGVVGSAYAILGGLRAVAVSDTLNGGGLLLVGVAVVWLGLEALGDGSASAGINRLLSEETHKLNAIGGPTDPTPFATLFTGMVFANLFYWCTNQYVIQRTLAARSLAEGQKGVLLSGFFKVMVPLLMMIPGVIAYHLYGPGLASIDLAYPQLVRDVLPGYATGLFLAVLLGAVLSSFNSLVNSAATLFCIDIYQPWVGGAVTDAQLLRMAKRVGLAITVFSLLVAPLLQFAAEGLWQVIRIFTGFYNIPMIAIVLVGLLTQRVPAMAAKVVIVFHITAYGLFQFLLKDLVPIHFLHLYAILFVIEVLIMLSFGQWQPRLEGPSSPRQAVVDLTPWSYAVPCAATLMSSVGALYLVFSPLGFAGSGSPFFQPMLLGLLLLNIFLWLGWGYRARMMTETR